MFGALLPFLENETLDSRIDEAVPKAERGVLTPVIFCCPGDFAAPFRANYAANAGTGAAGHGYNGVFKHLFGTPDRYGDGGFVRESDITDGPSNTAAFSEILSGIGLFDRRRVLWLTPHDILQPHFLMTNLRPRVMR